MDRLNIYRQLGVLHSQKRGKGEGENSRSLDIIVIILPSFSCSLFSFLSISVLSILLPHPLPSSSVSDEESFRSSIISDEFKGKLRLKLLPLLFYYQLVYVMDAVFLNLRFATLRVRGLLESSFSASAQQNVLMQEIAERETKSIHSHSDRCITIFTYSVCRVQLNSRQEGDRVRFSHRSPHH